MTAVVAYGIVDGRLQIAFRKVVYDDLARLLVPVVLLRVLWVLRVVYELRHYLAISIRYLVHQVVGALYHAVAHEPLLKLIARVGICPDVDVATCLQLLVGEVEAAGISRLSLYLYLISSLGCLRVTRAVRVIAHHGSQSYVLLRHGIIETSRFRQGVAIA